MNAGEAARAQSELAHLQQHAGDRDAGAAMAKANSTEPANACETADHENRDATQRRGKRSSNRAHRRPRTRWSPTIAEQQNRYRRHWARQRRRVTLSDIRVGHPPGRPHGGGVNRQRRQQRDW